MLVHDPGYTHPRKVLQRPPPASDNVVAEDAFLEPSPRRLLQLGEQHRSGPGEMNWEMLDDEAGMKAIEDAVSQIAASKRQRSLSGEAASIPLKAAQSPQTLSLDGRGQGEGDQQKSEPASAPAPKQKRKPK